MLSNWGDPNPQMHPAAISARTHALQTAGQGAVVELARTLARVLLRRFHRLRAEIRGLTLPLATLVIALSVWRATSRLRPSSSLTVVSRVACFAPTPALAKPLNQSA
jgi:hypothetical protein